MTKKLNTDAIASELAGSAFFPRPHREQPEANTPTTLVEKPISQEEQSLTPTPEHPNARSSER